MTPGAPAVVSAGGSGQQLLAVLQALAEASGPDAPLHQQAALMRAALGCSLGGLAALAPWLLDLAACAPWHQALQDTTLCDQLGGSVAAACLVALQSACSGTVATQLVASLYLPLMVHMSGTPKLLQCAEALSPLVVADMAADEPSLAEALLALCIASLPGSSSGAADSQASQSSQSVQVHPWDAVHLPTAVAACLLTSLLDAATRAVSGDSRPAEPAAVSTWQQAAVHTCLAGALCLVFDAKECSCVAGVPLLEALVRSAAAAGTSSLTETARRVWLFCCDRATRDLGQRRQALGCLHAVWPHLRSAHADQPSLGSVLLQDPAFWALIRGALCDAEAATRRCARALLLGALPPPAAGQPPWAPFTALLGLLDEFSLHLVKAAWEQHLALIRPGVCETDQQSIARDSAHRSADSEPAQQPPHDQPAGSSSPEELVPSEQWSFAWESALWARGLSHANPQSQRLVLLSFLSRSWLQTWLEGAMPPSFVVHSLLPAMLAVTCAPSADAGQALQQSQAFLSAYAATLHADRACLLVQLLLEAALSDALSRQAIHIVLSLACTAAAASQVATQDSCKVEWAASVLLYLQKCVLRLTALGGWPACRDAFAAVLSAAALATRSPIGPLLRPAIQLLEALPPAALRPGSVVLDTATAWLLGTQPCAAVAAQHDAALRTLLSDFLAVPGAPPPAEELRGAPVSPHGWAVMYSLLHSTAAQPAGAEGANISGRAAGGEGSLEDLRAALHALYRRTYLPQAVAHRTLAVLHALLEAVRMMDGGQCGALLRRIAMLACTVADDLVAYVQGTLSRTLYQASGPCAGSLQQQPTDSSIEHGHAQIGIRCVKLSVLCILQAAAPGQAVSMAAGLRTYCQFLQQSSVLLAKALHPGHAQPHLVLLAACECFEGLTALVESSSSSHRTAMPAASSTAMLAVEVAAMLKQAVDTFIRPPATVPVSSKQAVHNSAVRWSCARALLELAAACACGAAYDAAAAAAWPSLQAELSTATEQALTPMLQTLGLVLDVLVHSQENTVALTDLALPEQHVPAIGSDMTPGGRLLWAAVVPAWQAFVDCSKRPYGLCIALLAAVLTPRFFGGGGDAPSLPELHTEGGAIHWLVGQLMELGSRSPRVHLLTCLQLASLWAGNPATAACYMDTLETLLVDACDLGADDFDFQVHSGASSDLHAATALALPTVLPAPRLLPRIAVLCCVEQIMQACGSHTEAAQLARALWARLLDHAAAGPPLCPAGSAAHRRKLRTWQALAVLAKSTAAAEAPEAFQAVWEQLKANNQASVRQYQEAILVHLLQLRPDLLLGFVLPALADYAARWDGLASALYVAVLGAERVPPAVQAVALPRLAAVALPWAMSHHHALRTFAQLVLFHMLEHHGEAIGVSASPPLAALAAYMAANGEVARLRSDLGHLLTSFDLTTFLTPRGMFAQGCQNAELGRFKEGEADALLDLLCDWLAQERARLMAARHLASVPSVPAPCSQDFQRKAHPFSMLPGLQPSCNSSEQRLQTAVDSIVRAGFDDIMLDGQRPRSTRQELIIVASLVDKVPNLAGLARTAEVFRAKALVVHTKKVIKDVQFSAVSVTAEQWLPIVEVPAGELVHWLSRQQAEGWHVVALEQTANSMPLPQYKFARRTILVLGHEREGIPPQVLRRINDAVEIPQLGVLRSLNVHVAGALAMYEHYRQLMYNAN